VYARAWRLDSIEERAMPSATTPPADLHGCLHTAQADADRFHGGALPLPWCPQRRRVAARRGLLAALALALGAGVAGGVARQGSDPVVAVSIAQAAAPVEAPMVEPAPTPAPQITVTPAPRRATLHRHGAALTIDVAAMPLADAVQRLAALTGSRLIGDPAVLAAARPLTLAWRGADPAAAWHAVLRDEASYAIECTAARCRVWLLGAAALGAAPANAGAAVPQDSAALFTQLADETLEPQHAVPLPSQ
jgi:hypothetical protein